MLQTVLSFAAVIAPFFVAAAAWARSVDGRLDKLEQGQIGMSLQLEVFTRDQRRRHHELEE